MLSPAITPPAQAKVVIDKAVKGYRDQVHEEVRLIAGPRLHKWLLQRMSEVCIDYSIHIEGLIHSLSHEVDYDRSQKLAGRERDFSQQMRNFRYLLEYSLSLESDRTQEIDDEAMLYLVAKSDWLAVMYGASDHIHYGITEASLSISDEYVPSVEYASAEDVTETDFTREAAGFKLGRDLRPNDRIGVANIDDFNSKLDDGFLADTNFKFSDMIACLGILSSWRSEKEGRGCLTYTALAVDIIAQCVEGIAESNSTNIEKAIRFLVIPPDKIMRLAGASKYTDDVPMWEHNKRIARLTIRPLISENSHITWSPALARKAAEIWTTAVSSGYLPADFSWKHVDKIVRAIKQRLEKQLEHRAEEICRRATPYVEGGINFKSRFPAENFEDVGDFDVLAYWPTLRVILAVECKYNQPPFCLKDARRLRVRIFGDGIDRAQFAKIESRAAFFKDKADRLIELLGWPPVAKEGGLRYEEAYVSKDIYWWMRNPPYPVSTDFVRIDQLAFWLDGRRLR